MDYEGYIKIWRKMLESQVMKSDWLCRLWMWCLLKAQWRESKGIARGAFETTRPRGSEELSVTQSRFYKGLLKLSELGCIEVKSNNKTTVVTVCNYGTYQDIPDEITEKRTTKEQQSNNKVTTYLIEEELKNERKGADDAPIPLPFDAISPDFPTELNTPEFRTAWADLIAFRRTKRYSCREDWCKKQLKHLAGYGVAAATLAVQESFRNEWQGIFPGKVAIQTTKPTLTETVFEGASWADRRGS